MKSTPPGTRSVGNYIQIIIYTSIRLCEQRRMLQW